MSKKHKKFSQSGPAAVAQGVSFHEGEYRIIKHDLVRVIILNSIYLAAVLAVYFSNQKSHYLEAWFSKILHF